MSGKLMATLFIPYLLVSILGLISNQSYGTGPDVADNLRNQMYYIQTSDVKAIGTTTQTDEQRENILTAGFTFLSDATGTMFGFSKNLFSILTLNYSWWSDCKISTSQDMGYDLNGLLLTEPSGECYINQFGIQGTDAPLPYMMVRMFIIILAMPAIYVLLYKSAELFARFINAAGSGFSSIFSFLRGI